MATSVLRNTVGLLEVQNTVAGAKRTKRGNDGRQLELGANVARLVTQLLYWEGRGEAQGNWIHKSSSEWRREVGLNVRKLGTARRVAEEEGLIEQRQALRSSDRRQTIYYRLNVWHLARVVVDSKLAATNRRLKTERLPRERARLNKERRALEEAREDLGVIDDHTGYDAANPEAEDDSRAHGASPRRQASVGKPKRSDSVSITLHKKDAHPLQKAAPTENHHSKCRLTDDNSVEGESVASSADHASTSSSQRLRDLVRDSVAGWQDIPPSDECDPLIGNVATAPRDVRQRSQNEKTAPGAVGGRRGDRMGDSGPAIEQHGRGEGAE